MVSTFGNVSLSPYTEEELANTNRFTWASRAATSMFRVAVTFALWLLIGSSTERWTEGIAA